MISLPLIALAAFLAGVVPAAATIDPAWVVIDQDGAIETAVDDASAHAAGPGIVRVTVRLRYTRETPQNAPLWGRGVRATLLDQEVECARDGHAARLRVHRVWLTDEAGATLGEQPGGGQWIPADRAGSMGAILGGAICRRYTRDG